jgi:hypothetical protein
MQAMKLFNRQKDDQPQVEVEKLLESDNSQRRVDWRRTLPRLAAALLIVAAIVFLILWSFGAFESDKKDKGDISKSSGSSKSKNNRGQDQKQSGDSSSDNSSSAGQTPAGSAAGSAGATAGSSAQAPATSSGSSASSTDSSSLANTGPGETIALFAVATATGVIIYQISLRKQKS